MRLISFANINHGGLVNLKNSLKQGWILEIIGKGVVWKGWITRMKTIYEWLEQQQDKKEVIVLCDAFDVLCLQPSDRFLEQFTLFQRPIVMSAEALCFSNCFPMQHWLAKNPVANENKYCNAGLMCGEIQALQDLFQWLVNENWDDDQIGIAHYMDTFGINHMALDSNQTLFYNDNFGNQPYTIELDTNGLNKENKMMYPFFIHFPGMNDLHSVTWFHLFSPSKMFQTGKNYNTIGTHVNGLQHIAQNTPNKKLYQITLWSERATYMALAFFLIVGALVLRGRRKKQH